MSFEVNWNRIIDKMVEHLKNNDDEAIIQPFLDPNPSITFEHKKFHGNRIWNIAIYNSEKFEITKK